MDSHQPRLTRIFAIATIVAVASHALALTPENDSPFHLAGHWITNLAALGLAVLALVQGIRNKRDRAVWLLVSAGLAAWFGGIVHHTLVLDHLHGTHRWTSGDLFTLGYFGATFGILALLVRSRLPRLGPALALDAMLTVAVIAAFGALVVFQPLFEGGSRPDVTDGFITFSQPLFDLLVAAVIVAVIGLIGYLHRAWTFALALIATNAAVEAIGLRMAAAEIDVVGRMFDSLCPAAVLGLAYVASRTAGQRLPHRAEGWHVLRVPAASAVATLVLDVYSRLSGSGNWLAEVLVKVTLALVVARLLLAFHQNRGLLSRARHEARRDALTGLGNRRALMEDLREIASWPESDARVLLLFDLDGFKLYNDSFGHPAGDDLLRRLGRRLAEAVAGHGTAYRMGGDEFCVLGRVALAKPEEMIAATSAALSEHGEGFAIGSSYGAVVLPHEAREAGAALQIADQRMYDRKGSRPDSARRQSTDALLGVLKERNPELSDHTSQVQSLAVAVGRTMGLGPEELDELARAAELHDVGKIAIPDSILHKPGRLSESEWQFMRRHTIIGERIVAAVPALRSVGRIVRSSHERYDGKGYPDGLARQEIPLGARIVLICDAFDAMTSERCYQAAMSRDDAIAEIQRCAGSQFDPRVVQAFMKVVAADRDRENLEADEHDALFAQRIRELLGDAGPVTNSRSTSA